MQEDLLATLVDTCDALSVAVTEDSYGGVTEGAETLVWSGPCRFDPGGRVEQHGPERTVVQTTGRFWLPPDAVVGDANRIRRNGVTYPISGVQEVGTYGVLKAVNVEAVS